MSFGFPLTEFLDPEMYRNVTPVSTEHRLSMENEAHSHV